MVIVWRVVTACNLSCPFCAFDRSIQTPGPNANLDLVLSFGRILSKWAQARGESPLVSWMGGEPLLWPDFIEISAIFKNRYSLRLSVTTNGSALGDPSVRRCILAHYDELTVSVDGRHLVHDGLRGWPGGFATLSQVIPELRAARGAHGPLLRANVVLMRKTIGEFEALCRDLVNWGIEEITFNQLGGRDRPEFHVANALEPEQVDSFINRFPHLRKELARHGVLLKGSQDYLARIKASAEHRCLPLGDCKPGRNFLFIDELGRISPCAFTSDDCSLDLERISSPSDLDLLPEVFDTMMVASRPAVCQDCTSTQRYGKFGGSPNE